MIGSFKFNEVESSSFNLVCKSVSRPLLPAVKVKRVDIPGASGVYDFPNTEYSLRQVTMRVTYLETSFENMRSKARLIAAWLSTSTWGKLIINDEPDKYYLAKVTAATDMTALLTAGQADIIFDCLPFAYSTPGLVEALNGVTTNYNHILEFTNPGTKEINYRCPEGSQSLISLVGTWDTLSLSSGGVVMVYNAAQAVQGQLVEIDNIAMEVRLVTSETTWTNKFGALSAGMDTFLPIFPGVNTITIGGSSVDLDTITVEYIPLWI
jgi:predicted phage tail component-like protein